MKIAWFFIFVMSFVGTGWAQTLNLVEVAVNCPKSRMCEERRVKFGNLTGEYRSLVHLKDTLRLMSSDGGYQSFSYQILELDSKYSLTIDFKLKPVIKEINIGFTDRNLETDPSQLVIIKEGDFFEAQKLKISIDGIQKKIESMGYPFNSHTYEIFQTSDNVTINIAITLGRPVIFKNIKSNTSSSYVKEFLKRKFTKFYNRPFESAKFKFFLDEAQKELFSYGYYLISMDFTPVMKKERVTLDLNIHNDQLFAFDFKNLHKDDHLGMLTFLTDLFRKFKRPLTEAVLKQAISDYYVTKAMLNTSIKVDISKFTNKYAEVVTLYRITFDEKYKTRLVDVSFQGNSYFTKEKLKKMFDKEAFELASIRYYDQEYFNYFVGYLKNRYITKGFVQVKIQGPIKTFDEGKHSSNIEYIIQEGQRAFVRGVTFEGLPLDFEDRALAEMTNKVGQPFNPISLVEDIKKVAVSLQESGYYFAEVTNAAEDSMVSYSKSGADVDIHFVIHSGPIVRLNRILYLGNYKTRKRVILKKVKIEKDEIITPSKTREIEAAISATGLFNTVSVTPVKHNSQSATTDMIIRVSERDYGLLEFAPGYRTDLGIKLTGTASYTNIGGANRAITLTGQVNQRLNYQVFDPRRRKERKRLTEYNTSAIFTQGDLWDTNVDYSLGLSFQRKRFYSFDGDIMRVNNTFTRDWTKRFSSSFRHQLEKITQSDASEERDNGSFNIGAVTPSLTYDMRNSQTLPVKGAFFNASCEFANPYFLSQETNDLTINFYKFISRNRFYLPFKNGTVAISVVAGVQENLAKELVNGEDGKPNEIQNGPSGSTDTVKQTKGYIPNIKVFRLSGMDIVRGFTDEEINKLTNRQDISQVRVQNRAFLTNFKLEPRYFINDSLMAGVFLDAGRVYVDQVDLGELRSSAGVTFKVITPVGTLDFDYGLKLLRKKDINGNLETPGRFHVSIGFF